MEIANFPPEQYFDLSAYRHKELFDGIQNVWEAFERLEAYLSRVIEAVPLEKRRAGEIREGAKLYGHNIVIEEGAMVESTAYIRGPVWIGKKAKVGPGAFIRGPVVTGENCIIGNSTEARNTIMLNGSEASHFNYIGDSIMGSGATLGAGTALANTKINGKPVRIGMMDTGLARFGAVLADGVRIGCNAVTDPGIIINKGCLILPLTYLRSGVYEQGEEKFTVRKIL